MASSSLILAAFPPELADLAEDPPRGWETACTGVGALAAAVATTRLLVERRPDRVLFLGSCGAYDTRLEPGACLSAAEVLAVSLEELDGRAYRPALEAVRWVAGWRLPFPAWTVAVPPAITRTREGAQALGAVAAVENLELSGVFAACAVAGVPAAAALAVTNRVGPTAHVEWEARHAADARRLAAALRACGVLA